MPIRHCAAALLLACFLFSCHNKRPEKIATTIERLAEGNVRYRSGVPVHPDQSAKRLHEIAAHQDPFAIVVSCSDSRVPPELVFDQGLGDLFVVRTAGHVLEDMEMASIEYAVEHLHVKTIVVLGHENCGAMKAMLDYHGEKLPGHLNSLVTYLKTEPEELAVAAKGNADLKEVTIANIRHGYLISK